MPKKKTPPRVPRQKKTSRTSTRRKQADEALTALARDLVDELEKIELRRWDGWMDQMLQ